MNIMEIINHFLRPVKEFQNTIGYQAINAFFEAIDKEGFILTPQLVRSQAICLNSSD